MTTVRRGKAITPARPGVLIKQVLSGQRPLPDVGIVNEAAIVDLANAYKQFIAEQNQLRPLKSKLKGMTYPSFLKLFKFAQLLNLVELVREEKMLFPPSNGNLYSVRKGVRGGISAAISNRRIFRLSQRGIDDDLSWTDLCRAWRENWVGGKLEQPIVLEKPPSEIVEEIPAVEEYEEEFIPPTPEEEAQAIEEVIPGVITPSLKRKRGRPAGAKNIPKKVEGPITFTTPTFRLGVIPDKVQFTIMDSHLNEMIGQDFKSKGVKSEMKRLVDVVEDWTNSVVEKLEEMPRTPASSYIAYINLRNLLMELDEALFDNDMQRSISVTQKLLQL